MRLRPGALTIAIAVCVAAPPAAAQAPTVNLTPSQFPGVLEGPVRVGPMTLLNGTRETYRVRVYGVLLGQRRDGGIIVRDDRRSRARAARIIEPQVRSFGFVPGYARSVLARVKRVPRSGSFYGGVLFQATPVRSARSSRQQIRNILQLTASVLLDPPARKRRLRLSTGPVSATTQGRRLRLSLALTNRGNGYERVSGRLAVRDVTERVVARPRLKRLRVLPGATVDLTAAVAATLPAGRYAIAGSVRGGGRALAAKGTMRLFGENQVATRTARITELRTPTAYKGESVKIEGTFENTGNVAHAPRAVLIVRPVRGGAAGRVALRKEIDAERAKPGETGRLEAAVDLPGRASSYELTVTLAGARGAGAERSLSLTPIDKPPLATRVKDWVTGNAVVIVAALLALMAVGAALGVRYVRRLQAQARDA